jgi:hypothetical protein
MNHKRGHHFKSRFINFIRFNLILYNLPINFNDLFLLKICINYDPKFYHIFYNISILYVRRFKITYKIQK